MLQIESKPLRRLKLATLALALALASSTIEVQSAPLNWQTDMAQGLQLARQQGKPILVDVSAEWCHYCKKLDKEIFHDKKVSDMLSLNFVTVRIDFDGPMGKKMAKTYGIRGIPCLMVFDNNGNLKDRINGCPSTAADFMRFASKNASAASMQNQAASPFGQFRGDPQSEQYQNPQMGGGPPPYPQGRQMGGPPPFQGGGGQMNGGPPPFQGGGGQMNGGPPPFQGGGGQMNGGPPPFQGGGGQMNGGPPPFQGGGGQMNGGPPPFQGGGGQMNGGPPPFQGGGGQMNGGPPPFQGGGGQMNGGPPPFQGGGGQMNGGPPPFQGGGGPMGGPPPYGQMGGPPPFPGGGQMGGPPPYPNNGQMNGGPGGSNSWRNPNPNEPPVIWTPRNPDGTGSYPPSYPQNQ